MTEAETKFVEAYKSLTEEQQTDYTMELFKALSPEEQQAHIQKLIKSLNGKDDEVKLNWTVGGSSKSIKGTPPSFTQR